MTNFVTTFLARILAAWIAGAVSWLGVKYGITIDDAAQQAFVEHLVGVVIPLFMTLYALFHRTFSKKTNPGDAASGHLAAKESSETALLKL